MIVDALIFKFSLMALLLLFYVNNICSNQLNNALERNDNVVLPIYGILIFVIERIVLLQKLN